MWRQTFCSLCLGVCLLLAGGSGAVAENEGLADLDRATQLKVTVRGIEDLSEVIDRIDSAMEKGLDEENAEFAEQLLVGSLMQRANAYSDAVMSLTAAEARPRMMQIRTWALTDLQRAIDIDDSLWEAHLLMGQLYSLPMGDPAAARRAFSKVVDTTDITPEQRAEALALRATVQRDSEQRLADLNQAVELVASEPEYLRLRAQHHFSEDKFDEALKDVDSALELEDDHAATHELRGIVLLGLNRQEEALASFDRASELVPESAQPYQHRGALYRQQGNLEKSLEQLTKAIELAPDSVGTLLVRASVYFAQGNAEKALEDVEAAIRLQPGILQAHLMRAEIYAATNRLPQAISQLDRLAEMAPRQPQLLTQLGTFYLMADEHKKAIETFTEAIEIEPEEFRSLRFRGDAYLNLGQHHEAVADFDRAMALDDKNDGLLNNLAWVLATSPMDDVRDGKRAVELATKASEMNEHQTPHILSTLAAAYAETGDFESAIEWAQKAVDIAKKALEDASEAERQEQQSTLEQLESELASYREGKPWRELQAREPKDASAAGQDANAEGGEDAEETAAPADEDRDEKAGGETPDDDFEQKPKEDEEDSDEIETAGAPDAATGAAGR